MTASIAYQTVSYGTWGVGTLKTTIAPKTPLPPPPAPPTNTPPTGLRVVETPAPVYAFGQKLVIQHPDHCRREKIEVKITKVFKMRPHVDKRRVALKSLTWLYLVAWHDAVWLLNETAINQLAASAEKPLPKLLTLVPPPSKPSASTSTTAAA